VKSQAGLERMRLGGGDLAVSPLGLGTNTWGSGGGPGADLSAAFSAAVAAGINFIDTAEVYRSGESERAVGRLLQTAKADMIVATKFMPLPWRLRKAEFGKALRGSLTRLGLERIDLYMTHFPFPPVPIETWMDALADAVAAGLVRAAGVSNYGADQMRRAHAALARRGVRLASNQVEYSLLRRGPERDGLLEACRELGVTLVAYRPLAAGLLGGIPDRPGNGAGARFGRPQIEAIRPLAAVLEKLARSRGKTPAQVALNWVMCKGALPIAGARTARHVAENAGALGWRLSGEEVAELDLAGDRIG
jgi:aryl-alcohol dehydrogenase-like predicted oxidoreductase